MTNKHKRFFEICEKLSTKSNHHEFKLGAIVVEKNRIIGLGVNKLKSHPRSLNKWATIHAELDAILSCKREDLSGCELYIFRRGRDGRIRKSLPCISCQDTIKQVGIKKIHYTINDGFGTRKIGD